jgi:hypothetical protein
MLLVLRLMVFYYAFVKSPIHGDKNGLRVGSRKVRVSEPQQLLLLQLLELMIILKIFFRYKDGQGQTQATDLENSLGHITDI